MTRLSKILFVSLATIMLGGFTASAQQVTTNARQAILIDAQTGYILMEKDPDTPMPPASMSKLMTVLMVFEKLDEGTLDLNDTFEVSQKAWKFGGSKMFVMVKDQIRVADLLRGIIVQSGNDACVVVAEGLMGTEEAFADAMTSFGTEIGLTGSTFKNATGWPHPEHRTTPRDLSKIAHRIITKHSDYYPIFAETEFVWSDIKQGNRNPLLYKNMGVDGLKTGHTEEAGYGLVSSAIRDGRRLIMVISGLTSVNERSQEGQRLMEWGFRSFDNYTLFEQGQVLDEADVWLGNVDRVPLTVDKALTLTMAKTARKGMKVKISYDSPVAAPITRGQKIGIATITAPGMEPIVQDVLAGADVAQLGMVGRLQAAFNYLVWGASGNE